MYVSFGSIILSVISLFLPVVSYQSAETWQKTRYNIIGLLSNQRFIDTVFWEYTGDFMHDVSDATVGKLVVLLSVIGVLAIILAFIGIRSMSKQYESSWPFVLALSGLIGTAIPAVVLLILYIMAKSQFKGDLSLGAYIFITPIAMIIACIHVINRHHLTRSEIKLQKAAQAYIYPAGDLPVPYNQETYR